MTAVRSARTWSRGLSLAAACGISLTLMLFPFVLRGIPGARLHLGLPILMLGVAGAFVHGIGFTPDNRFLRLLFGPAGAWLLIAAGTLVLLAV